MEGQIKSEQSQLDFLIKARANERMTRRGGKVRYYEKIPWIEMHWIGMGSLDCGVDSQD